MNLSARRRYRAIDRALSKSCPQLETLEDRLPLGDVLVGTVFGSAWLGATLALEEPGPLTAEGSSGDHEPATLQPAQQNTRATPAPQNLAVAPPPTETASRSLGIGVEAVVAREAAFNAATGISQSREADSATGLSWPTLAAFATNKRLLAQSVFAGKAPAGATADGTASSEAGLLRSKGDFVSDALPVRRADTPSNPATAAPLEPTHLGPGPGGFQWDPKFTGPNWVFEDISFGDSQTGFVAAELGKVLRTQDGGKSWDTVMNLGFPYYWYGVHALDAQRAVIAGFNNQTGDGVVRWTSDGGNTWSDNVILTGNPNPVRWLDKIAFVDDSNGIAMAAWSGGNHSTASGGQEASDWNYVQADPARNWFQGNFTYWPDGNVWASGISFCHSADYGQNWSCQHSIDSVFDGGGVSFPDADHGWVAGGSIAPEVRGWVHRTTDGGQTWSGRILDAPFPIRSTLFLNDDIGFAAGGNVYSGVGGIYSTTDGGDTWNLDINTGAEMKSLKAVWTSKSTADVWCVGFAQGFTGEIFKTQVELAQ